MGQRRSVEAMRLSFVVKNLGLLTLVCVLGCGKDDGRVKVYPVTGKVLVDGQPAEGVTVVFYPTAAELKGPGMPVPAGTTDGNGEFRLRSFDPNDGAPEGEYKVTVFWPAPLPPGVDPYDEMYEPQDRLQGRYSNPDTTPLTATVPEGGGELPPFDLQ